MGSAAPSDVVSADILKYNMYDCKILLKGKKSPTLRGSARS